MSLKDSLVVFFSCMILIACSYFFYREIQPQSNRGDQMVGKIYFRYRVAETRPAQRVVWAGVDQGDAVFNRDSVRTDELSEAIIVLDDGTAIEMDPETMIVLEINKSEPTIRFEGGSILIRRDSKKKIKVTAGETEIEMKSGAARIDKTDSGLDISAVTGELQLEKPPDKIPSGSKLIVEGDKKELVETLPQLVGPPDNTRYFTEEPGYSVVFSFQGSDCNRPAILNLTPLNGTTEKIQANREDVSSILAEGIYYWNIECGNLVSQTRKIRVIRMDSIELAYPYSGQVLNQSASMIPFSWIALELAAEYEIQISKTPDFSDVAINKKTKRSSISLKIPEGTYYWKVKAKAAAPGASVVSKVHSFKVEKNASDTIALQIEGDKEAEPEPVKITKPRIPQQKVEARKDKPVNKPKVIEQTKPEKPQIISPPNGSTLDMSKSSAIIFKWSPVKTADRYSVSFKGPGASGATFSSKTNSYRFSDLSKLDVGRFSVKVTAYSGQKQISNASSVFSIILSEGPEKPDLEIESN